jgi:hypothetical protein
MSLERLGEGGMQSAVLTGEQVVMQRFADESVPERVTALLMLHDEHLRRHCFAERGVQVGLGDPSDVGEDFVVDGDAAGRSNPKDALGGLGKRVDSGQQHVAQRRAQCVHVPAAGQAGELLDEEGVALGPAVDRVEQARVDLGAENAGELLGHLRPLEPRQLGSPYKREPLHLREHAAERVAAAKLVAAVGEDEEHSGAAK